MELETKKGLQLLIHKSLQHDLSARFIPVNLI